MWIKLPLIEAITEEGQLELNGFGLIDSARIVGLFKFSGQCYMRVEGVADTLYLTENAAWVIERLLCKRLDWQLLSKDRPQFDCPPGLVTPNYWNADASKRGPYKRRLISAGVTTEGKSQVVCSLVGDDETFENIEVSDAARAAWSLQQIPATGLDCRTQADEPRGGFF